MSKVGFWLKGSTGKLAGTTRKTGTVPNFSLRDTISFGNTSTMTAAR